MQHCSALLSEQCGHRMRAESGPSSVNGSSKVKHTTLCGKNANPTLKTEHRERLKAGSREASSPVQENR